MISFRRKFMKDLEKCKKDSYSSQHSHDLDHLLNAPVTWTETDKAVCALKNGKGAGIESVIAEVLVGAHLTSAYFKTKLGTVWIQ